MNMHSQLKLILSGCASSQDADGIYSNSIDSSASEQNFERELRESVASQSYENYFSAISKSHSIQVMDYEIDRYLARLPRNSVILDVGGCWGWHWRRLAETRPDVGILIVDFVRTNLLHSKEILRSLIGSQVALMHADATALPFDDANGSSLGFDGIWTVQVFQHIPNFTQACRESHRVLKDGGLFVNYSLHATPIAKLVYALFRKDYHLEGPVSGQFYLSRANIKQRKILSEIFGKEVLERYTECLFHPDLKLSASGKLNSIIGRLDAKLGERPWIGRWLARQHSYEVEK